MSDQKTFKMSDDLIAVVRELVQLSLITGTNIVDHLRAIELEVDSDSNKMIPTIDYINAYNAMVEELVKKANESQKKLDQSVLDDSVEFVNPEEPSISN
jgi:flagellar capping protein FliD